MSGRTIAIGDIHGMYDHFIALLEFVDLQKEDLLIVLGDYCDRGPNTKGVVDKLIELQLKQGAICLKGNHEEMLLAASESPEGHAWLGFGGWETLESYGGSFDDVPESHMIFYEECLPYHEDDNFIFVHAGVDPDLPLKEQHHFKLHWQHIDFQERAHCSGKTIICGHSSQKDGNILDKGFAICIDTYCHGGQNLTAYDPYIRQAWQINGKMERNAFTI